MILFSWQLPKVQNKPKVYNQETDDEDENATFAFEMKKGMKPHIHARCMEVIKERIEIAREAVNNAQEAANSEDKSSAGDKYETGRSMGQLDRDMFAKQLAEAEKDYAQFKSFNPEIILKEVGRGALIELESGIFYLVAGVGSVQTDFGKILAISMNSPLATAMSGKKKGDEIMVNGKTMVIKAVE